MDETGHSLGYRSTRGGAPALSFREVILEGLAPDGGLYVPERIPDVRDRLDAWSRLPYRELALEVMAPFVDLPRDVLRRLIDDAYRTFRHPEVAPVVAVGERWILELFHGPTLAFKDIALQFLGHLFEHVLERADRRLNILAATSGDTGSAAIHGVLGRPRIRIFVLHPRGRVSPLQERQMTSVIDPRVFNLAVDGTFDDCQRIMKAIFRDTDFKRRRGLGSVNSVNWARVLAQIVYYFHAAFRVMERTGARAVRFAVPTGNFGDVLAGWYAARMGLPIGRLVLATNENDILARFFNSGRYRAADVVSTLSPSMDIQVASNFERYLLHRLGGDPARLRSAVEGFERGGDLAVETAPGGGVDPLIRAERVDTEATLDTIRRTWDDHRYLLDPHTAVGVRAAAAHASADEPTIALATAHPAKFPEAIRRATGRDLARHEILDALRDAPTRCDTAPADAAAVRAYLEEKLGGA